MEENGMGEEEETQSTPVDSLALGQLQDGDSEGPRIVLHLQSLAPQRAHGVPESESRAAQI
ncbi:hypothetical protein JZ751_023986 [Albula glossodonta]|uniref:Uncharacterized protein n=1 Tax=Albula glossodonta TaxID=121402 RepID=A0A8T2NHU0_9TELE|nr:hypothetical protein JZ751_023986 [Albula glossodonta]